MLDAGVQLLRLNVARHPCAYFAGRAARTEFVDSRAARSPNAYSGLAPLGFRRTGNLFYRPQCEGCADCVPMRVLTHEFSSRRRFRRILAKNADVVVRTRSVLVDDPPFEMMPPLVRHYMLFDRYIRARHADGDMFPPSLNQFRGLFSASAETFTLDAYLDDVLVASAVTDVLVDGLAAVYTFFEPNLPARSLGAFSILQQIEECRRRALPHLYLGYWVVGAAKMEYKADYWPAEFLRDGRWQATRHRASDPTRPAKH